MTHHRTDDWRAPNGDVIPAPTTDAERLFSTAYNYCVTNWCVDNSGDSLFTYGSGESFEDIHKCDVPFSSVVEQAVNDPPQDLADACGGNLVCLVDGLCGDITDAVAAKQIEEVIVETQEEVKARIFPAERVDVQPTPPPPTPSPTSSPSTSSEPSHRPSASPSASPSKVRRFETA